MIDIKFLREHPDIVKENIKKKFQDHKLVMVDEVIEFDKKNREAQLAGDTLRSERKTLSSQIGELMKAGKKEEAENLRDYRAAGEKFSLVVLDPPAFCKSAAEVKDAYRGYKDINLLGMKLVEKGGFLATCSCSQHMTPVLFDKMLAEAAKESGRKVRCLETRSQAPDHPALLNQDETRYLKFSVLQVL